MSTPGEDDEQILGYDGAGQPITRRSIREAHETARMISDDFILTMRRMLTDELTFDQIGALQRLFTMLGSMKNPIPVVSWWEGQIDLAVHMRVHAAPEAVTEPDPEPDPEPPAAGYTLNAHPFQASDAEETLCSFSAWIPGVAEAYVCELAKDSKPHEPFNH